MHVSSIFMVQLSLEMPQLSRPDMQTAEPAFRWRKPVYSNEAWQTEEPVISAADTKAQLY